jgi:L-ribulose-5-phosphate 3-epimerase
MNRRRFLQNSVLVPGLSSLGLGRAPLTAAEPKFRLSLAEWSLHRAIQSRLITNLDFPRIAREQFDIEGLEFVNQLWEAPTQGYVQSLKANMQKTGTKGVLLMVDREGEMGHSGKAERMRAAQNHYKWVDIAAELGCHSIRANMYSDRQPATAAETGSMLGWCAESFANLCEYAAKQKINVLIENHGGVSSDPDSVVRLMKMVNLPNFGTLPDFGNFPKTLDKYEAVRQLMPFAKGASYKCNDFGPDGQETALDTAKMMKIVLDAGYRGYVGIEYEGTRLSEFEGIQAAKRLLEKLL